MIAQADRRPDFRTQTRGRHVDRIEELRGHRHRLALVLPQVGDERAQLVEQRGERQDRQRNRQRLPADHSHAADQRPRPHEHARFLPAHALGKLALGRAAAEFGVDLERREPLPRERAHRRDQRAQQHQHRRAHNQRHRREDRDNHEQWQAPRLHQRERQIFGIFDRAVLRALVVDGVDALVHETGHQQRDADQQIPCHAETGQRIAVDMGEFVNEHQRAVERERRHQSGDQLHRKALRKDRGGNPGITYAC